MMDPAAAATLLASSAARRADPAPAYSLHRPKAMTAAQMDTVARDFESLFVAEMAGQMFGDSLGDEMFGDKDSRDIYKSMMVDAYGKQVAAAGGIGIASYVKRELLAMQEISHDTGK